MQNFHNVTRKPRNSRPNGSPQQQFNDLLHHLPEMAETLLRVHNHCTHWSLPENWDRDIQQDLFFTAELARIIKLMTDEREFSSIWKKHKDTILDN